MKKKTVLVSLAMVSLSLGALAYVGSRVDTSTKLVQANDDHVVTLDSTTSPVTGWTTKKSVQYGWVKLNYFIVNASSGNHVLLGKHGSISNFSTDSGTNYGKITGIKSIKVSFSGGDLYLQTNVRPDGKDMGEKQKLTSGEEVAISNKSFFKLSAGDAQITINKIVITYSCVEDQSIGLADFLGKSWTGKDADGIVWQVTAKATGVEIKSLNKAVNDSYVAAPSLNGDQLALSINGGAAVYNGRVFNYGHVIKFTSATGAYAAIVPNIDLYRVYDVQDFEEYTATGVGYDQSNVYANSTNLRSCFHSDYMSKGTQSKFFADSSWSIMGSADYVTFTAEGGLNGSKAAILKTNTNKMRYISMSAIEPTQEVIGRGAYLSFWAKGGYTSSTSSAQSSNNTTFKVRGLYASGVTGASDANGTLGTVTIPAGSDWTQYMIPLNMDLDYYGYSFYSETATSYVPIDNIQIFTHNPYEEYVAPEALDKVTYCGTGVVQTGLGDMKLWLDLGANGACKAYFNGANLEPNNYQVDDEGNMSLDVTYSQDLSTYGLGTVTVTQIQGKFVGGNLTNVTLVGSGINSVATNNGSITFTEAEGVLGCNEETAALQQAWNRYNNTGSWVLDESEDRIVADDTQAIEGTGSMKVKCSSKFSLTLKNNLDPAAFAGAGYWVKNNTGKALKVNIYYYYTADLSSAQNNMSVLTIPSSNSWVLVQNGFKKVDDAYQSIRNVRLYFELSGSDGSEHINIDYAHLYF